MPLRRLIPRNRRIPDRATGYIAIVIQWSGGKILDRSLCQKNLEPAFKILHRQLQLIPADEMGSANIRFDAHVRKSGGGTKRVALIQWKKNDSLESFKAAARSAWNAIPKEDDDQGQEVTIA